MLLILKAWEVFVFKNVKYNQWKISMYEFYLRWLNIFIYGLYTDPKTLYLKMLCFKGIFRG